MVCKVLIVEDNNDILEALQVLFSSSGYAVEAISDGRRVMEAADALKPDVIILDMLLSGVNGLTICNSFKLADDTKHIPVVMMSAHPAGKQLSLAAGANAFVAKPFEIDTMMDTVQSLVG